MIIDRHIYRIACQPCSRAFLFVLMTVLLAGCGGDSSTANDARPKRGIYDALRYGDNVFPVSQWAAYAQEGDGFARAGWRSSALNAVAWIDYLYYGEQIDQSRLVNQFDETWFDEALAEYETWQQLAGCVIEGTVIYEFGLQADGVNYIGRFWGRVVEPAEILTLYMVFPAESIETLNIHARRFDEAAFACGQSN